MKTACFLYRFCGSGGGFLSSASRETIYRIVISESGKEEKRALQCRCDEAMELVEDLGQYHRLLISDLVGGREIRIHLTRLAGNRKDQ